MSKKRTVTSARRKAMAGNLTRALGELQRKVTTTDSYHDGARWAISAQDFVAALTAGDVTYEAPDGFEDQGGLAYVFPRETLRMTLRPLRDWLIAVADGLGDAEADRAAQAARLLETR